MLKKRLQKQLERIEKEANAYFDKAVAESYSGSVDFDNLTLSSKKLYSEISEQLADVVKQLSKVTQQSPLFDDLDQKTLRNSLRRADAALRFCRYQHWGAYEVFDEDIFKAVVPAVDREYPTNVSSAREDFKEGLDAIKRILILIPSEVHDEIMQASAVDTKTEDGNWWEKINDQLDSLEKGMTNTRPTVADAQTEPKQILSAKEFAKEIGKNPRTVKRYVEQGIIKANQNEAGRILSIPRSQLDSLLKKKD